MPRSGTTWISQIFASSPDVRMKFCPLFSYEFKNALNEESTPNQWRDFFDAVYHTPSPYMDQEHLRKDGLVPNFGVPKEDPNHLMIKSNRFHHLIPHVLEKAPDLRVVYLVRHPAATLYSWLDNPTEFPAGANPLEQWRSGDCRKDGVGEFWGFNDWKKVTLQALKLADQYPNRFRLQRYEKLVLSPTKEVQELFDFFELDLGRETLDFISASRQRHDTSKRSVFKGAQLNFTWKTGLPDEILNEIRQDLAGSPLDAFASDPEEAV